MWQRGLSSGRREEGTYTRLTEERQRTKTRVVFYFLGFAAVIGWLYVIFISNLFVIAHVEVSGLRSLDTADVSREVYAILDHRSGWRPWPARHAWFINRPVLAEELKTRLFAVSVVVDKSYGNVLRLKIEERSNKLILHTHKQYFWVDLDGIAIAELTSEQQRDSQQRILGGRPPRADDPPLIHVDLDEPVAVNFHVGSSENVKTWIRAAEDIERLGLAYRELQPPTASTTHAVITASEGYPIWIDFDAPLEPQIKTYEAFKRTETNPKVSEYVDVRIPGRVYVK